MSLFQQHVERIQKGSSDAWTSAHSLYDAMTEAEKLSMLDGDWSMIPFLYEVFVYGPNFTPAPAGVVKRLGVPGILFSDGPRGVVMGKSTAFPTTSTRAATWNPKLEEEIGVAMGREMRAQGANCSGAVCVNLVRHPKWGRAQESYGEDPLILGTLGASLSRGIRPHGFACVKHFMLNSMENLRFRVNVLCDEATMYECYLPHFKQCLDEGGAETMMSSYNAVNGACMGDNHLLNAVVRGVWKREDVFLQSDWMYGTKDAVASVNNGLDLEMPVPMTRKAQLPAALADGRVRWDTIRTLCVRMLAAQLRLYVRLASTPNPDLGVVQCFAHRDIARRAATEGMILLKNSTATSTRLLPLVTQKTILVVGELAKSVQTGDGGSSLVKEKKQIITPLAGIEARSGVTVTYQGCTDIAGALRMAKQVDVVLLLVGYTAKEEGERIVDTELNKEEQAEKATGIMRFAPIRWILNSIGAALSSLAGPAKGGDRETLRLIDQHEAISTALAKEVGDKLIVGIESSGTVILPAAVRSQAAAILFTGYGGCEFGTALRQVLWNEEGVEPSGRLPFVIPERESDHCDLDFKKREVVYDKWWGYRWMQKHGKRAAYPFGFGLGYGDVRIFPQMKVPSRISSRFFSVSATVQNRGAIATSAVVQIYAGKAERRHEDEYQRVLVGWTKVRVNPGETTEVMVECRLDPVAKWNLIEKHFDVPSGDYSVYASRYEGDSSANAVVHVERVGWDN